MEVYLSVVVLFVLSILSIIVYKTYKFVSKFNKIYKYFSEQETKFSIKSAVSTRSNRPPINGECPKESELK